MVNNNANEYSPIRNVQIPSPGTWKTVLGLESLSLWSVVVYSSQSTYGKETFYTCSVRPISKLQRNPWQWGKFRPPLGIEKVNVFQLQGASIPWSGALPLDPAGGSAPNFRYRLAQSPRHPPAKLNSWIRPTLTLDHLHLKCVMTESSPH